MSEPLLSVCLITYNHANFIEEAIESVLMQKVNFSWELIIADDCSTDGTREIVQKYKEQYPDFINLILQENNVGAAKNWLALLKAPKSKYIAYFEGDDYWIDPLKLQKQVDFLETNKDFSITFCNVFVKYENANIDKYMAYQNKKMPEDYIPTIPIPEEITDIYDLAKVNYIHTPGVVFRNIFNNTPFPEYMEKVSIGDWPLYMFIAQYGKIRFFNEVMAVYRVHNKGLYSSVSRTRKIYLALGQFPAMINEGIFEEKIIQHWEKHIIGTLADFIKISLNAITEEEAVYLLNIYNSTKPSLLKKSIESLIEGCAEHKSASNTLKFALMFKLRQYFSSIIKSIKKRVFTNIFSNN